ncbi:Inner membrane ALBINO3-like protein 2, chloroplastic [Porphyridium purpureum]|uniref:Inner membrane ALBINO3-like protein 2, chloroplastic n=1 Tax=Porphyridium purpureum TaxID=35688 RepID=A0A5J4YX64_PORPP|nr:Inner membrane ALBINO3-like protein 2, chloroplastic [Porphyridium purpureum]|eukprot:POR5841..scf209_3
MEMGFVGTHLGARGALHAQVQASRACVRSDRSAWRPESHAPARRSALPLHSRGMKMVAGTGVDMAFSELLAQNSHVVAAHALMSLQMLADAAASVSPDDAKQVLEEAAKPGLFGQFVNLIELAIGGIHGGLGSVGLGSNTWGFSIIAFTIVVKALTFPLNFKQMSSTIKMQEIQPRLKEIQTKYRDNPQVMNQMIAEMYQKEQINPLAGCLPVLAQLPIWIGLYRAVLNLAEENKLQESFFWLPSLQGPVVSSSEGGLKVWLFPFVNGAPPVGWHDALCYLVLPVALVLSQVWSQRVLTPPSDDPQMQQTQKILQFMPLLIGWFSLNVPSALGLYWVANNFLSTGQTILIRKSLGATNPAMSGPSGGADSPSEESKVIDVTGFDAGTTKKSGKGGKKSKRK